eukprot:Gb_01735 [translate_table: standard]
MLFVFRESLAYNGNNKYLPTSPREGNTPYGIDYLTHRPTECFSNGLNILDIICKRAKMYLSWEHSGGRVMQVEEAEKIDLCAIRALSYSSSPYAPEQHLRFPLHWKKTDLKSRTFRSSIESSVVGSVSRSSKFMRSSAATIVGSYAVSMKPKARG